MKSQLDLVKEFHDRGEVPVADRPTLIPEERSKLRHSLMAEEVKEYLEGAEKNDLHNIAKELADILYTVYGTILEHGLQDKIEEVFKEVHDSNMSKDISPGKAKKGADYREADIKRILQE